MAKHLNKIEFMGYLGADPVMRNAGGKSVVNFSVASSDQYTNSSGEKVKTTTWYRCSAWDKAAEVYNTYLKKGSMVLVVGKLIADPNGNPRIWEGNDGASKANFEVQIRELFFLNTKSSDGSASDGGSMDQAPAVAADDSDDLPF